MAKSKKEKKAARRERAEQLKSISQRIQDKLLLEATEEKTEEIIYTLAPAPPLVEEAAEHAEGEPSVKDGSAAAAAAEGSNEPSSAAAAALGKEHNEEGDEGDRVVLPSLGAGSKGGTRPSSSALAGRKHHKMSWEELKVRAAEKFGPAATEIVSEHDGNAVDPLFTVRMKMEPHTVPVPSHWKLQRTFLSRQADREEAVGIVPAEVAALGIEKIRATKDKKASPNRIAFLSCFMTGTPLRHKTYQVELSSVGDVFYEGKWRVKTHHVPGVLSSRLRQALGIGPTAPPPWLYSMQAMRRLPPAYPEIRIPGLNAPIPAGGQWGQGEGQWGEPPRSENNAFLFPGVRDEVTAAGAAQVEVRWGTVPPLAHPSAAETNAPTPLPSTSAPSPAAVASPRPASPSGSRPNITPVPFQPQAYVPQQAMPAARVTPQEFVHVQDNTANSTVAVGYVMMPKDGVQQPQQQQYPAGNVRPASPNAHR
ncbi:putative spliceosome-associated protein [Leptomonas pyrrhocoris]|uniref:Putative spliceosome-associated protein n=1 Tax=Leptomonas pyrrhocoris TaxID=157538 RepID=A0A0M9G5Y8_LEPPY|nr:putative spliceosome-associated protein [Leptomonas pyrrhocoris]KPA83037.1 putative spliceosome-associated protein [Leptomonas pyrrhocoris]|eukprot:XP_015661476.1 putative spliceosome-associated protein [Leptomonas pyrrhocoris]